jgi:hypothetical protein
MDRFLARRNGNSVGSGWLSRDRRLVGTVVPVLSIRSAPGLFLEDSRQMLLGLRKLCHADQKLVYTMDTVPIAVCRVLVECDQRCAIGSSSDLSHLNFWGCSTDSVVRNMRDWFLFRCRLANAKCSYVPRRCRSTLAPVGHVSADRLARRQGTNYPTWSRCLLSGYGVPERERTVQLALSNRPGQCDSVVVIS